MRTHLGHPHGRPTDSQHTNPTSQAATKSEQSAARSLGPARRRITTIQDRGTRSGERRHIHWPGTTRHARSDASAVPSVRSQRLVTRRLSRLAIGLSVAACALVLGAGAASADDWSPFIPPQQWPGYFGDCTITSGPVYDWYYPKYTSHGFAVIGGGQLRCNTAHSYQIRTVEFYSGTGVGASYLPVATSRTYSATDAGFYGMLETGRVCGSGYWFTRVIVSVAGYQSLYFDSYANKVAANGYSAAVC